MNREPTNMVFLFAGVAFFASRPFAREERLIELEKVSKTYDGGRTFAVKEIDLSIETGKLVVVLGESGCGKTTTLKMINRLIEPTSGEILVDGEDVTARDAVELRRSIGYVFQGIGLFPHMTVAENIAVVPRLLRWEEGRTRERVDELLDLVGLDVGQYRERMPDNLSGGEKQRVGVARALAAHPTIMLMDEPFGALDPLTRDNLQGEYRSIHERLGLTTVMVTHDMTEALLLGDLIAVVSEGRILRYGTPAELLNDPRDDYVSRLMTMPKDQADRVERLVSEASAASGDGDGVETEDGDGDGDRGGAVT